MSSTQYQPWYNQIFAGFLMNVDDFLGKAGISMGNTPNMQNFGHFLLPYGIFKGTRWSQNFRESNLFFLQEVSYTKMFGMVCSIWKCQHKLV